MSSYEIASLDHHKMRRAREDAALVPNAGPADVERPLVVVVEDDREIRPAASAPNRETAVWANHLADAEARLSAAGDDDLPAEPSHSTAVWPNYLADAEARLSAAGDDDLPVFPVPMEPPADPSHETAVWANHLADAEARLSAAGNDD